MDTIQHGTSDDQEAAKSTSARSRNGSSDFDAYCPPLVIARAKVVELLGGKLLGLVLAGNTGCGKTHLARIASQYYADQARMIGEAELVDSIRATYGNNGVSEQDIIKPLRRAKILIIDDVGVGYVKELEWLHGIYWQLLDKRFEAGLSVLMTTNLTLPQLIQRLGARAASRLTAHLGDSSNYVDMFGVNDYRMRNWKGQVK